MRQIGGGDLEQTFDNCHKAVVTPPDIQLEVKRNSTIYVGDSIVRKTDSTLNKDVVCLPGAIIEHVTERAPQIMGRGHGGTILVHIRTNNADKEGTTAIVDKYRNQLR